MATPYQNVDYLVNKLRESFVANNRDERNVMKFLDTPNAMAFADDFGSLRMKQNSPPVTFDVNLDPQAEDETENGEMRGFRAVPEDVLPISSTLRETLREGPGPVDAGTVGTVGAASHSTIQLDKARQSSERKSSGNIIRTNFQKLLFRNDSHGDGSHAGGHTGAAAGGMEYDSDQSDDTNITDPEYGDAALDQHGDLDTETDEYMLAGDVDGTAIDGFDLRRDDLTQIDHGGGETFEDDIDDQEMDGALIDAEFDNDDSGNFLTDSDLTDSDALLADDSFNESGSSVLMGNHSNSSGDLLRIGTTSRRGSNQLTKRPSLASIRHRSRTVDTRPAPRDKRLNDPDTASNSVKTDHSLGSQRTSKSYSNLPSAAHTSPHRVEEQFLAKQTDLVKPTLTSKLTLALQKPADGSPDRSVLESFKFVGETEGPRSQAIKVYLPTSDFKQKLQVFKISRTSLVKDFIGYVLLTAEQKDGASNADPVLQNPNYWCLRMVEDDGEVDDDFGPLDRGKPIAGFGVEEVGLQRVSPEQFAANERLYPLPKLVKADENDDRPDQPSQRRPIQSLIPEETSDDDLADTRTGGITLPASNVLKEKYDEEASQRDKAKKEDPNKRKPLASYRQRSFLSSSSVNNVSRQSPSLKAAALVQFADSTGGLTTSSFFKWTVWRHHQLSFKNRHQRSLSIDGEYIYIIPDSTLDHDNVAYKYLVDANNAKTTSFHVSQIIKCKQSRKVPVNLKIVVLKASGPKRYDLEAMDVVQSEEIVKAINNLMNIYALGK